MSKLSPHFTLEELTVSDTATRLGIDNTPGLVVSGNLLALARGMEMVRTILGGRSIHVNSGFRCEELEKVLCAKDFVAWCSRNGKMRTDPAAWAEYFKRKAHPKGFACDFTCPKFGTPLEIVKALIKAGIKADQIIQEGTWVHISFDPKMRGQVLTATFNGGTPSYTQGV